MKLYNIALKLSFICRCNTCRSKVSDVLEKIDGVDNFEIDAATDKLDVLAADYVSPGDLMTEINKLKKVKAGLWGALKGSEYSQDLLNNKLSNTAAIGKSSKLGGGKSKKTVKFVLPDEEEFDANCHRDNGNRGKREGEHEINRVLSKSKSERRSGNDNGIVMGGDRDKGKPHEEHEHNQVLTRSKSERGDGSGTNNGIVIGDDTNKGKHFDEYEINQVLRRRSARSDGNDRDMHQLYPPPCTYANPHPPMHQMYPPAHTYANPHPPMHQMYPPPYTYANPHPPMNYSPSDSEPAADPYNLFNDENVNSCSIM